MGGVARSREEWLRPAENGQTGQEQPLCAWCTINRIAMHGYGRHRQGTVPVRHGWRPTGRGRDRAPGHACLCGASRVRGGGEATRRREKCDLLYAGPRRWNSGHRAGPRRSRLFPVNTIYFRRYGNRIEMLTALYSRLGCGSRACRPKCWNEVAAVEDARVTRRTPTGSTHFCDNARHGVVPGPG